MPLADGPPLQSELAPPDVVRALRYVYLLNDQGERPTERQVQVFSGAMGPRPPTMSFKWLSGVARVFEAFSEMGTTIPGETVTAFLARMEWAEVESGGVSLTTLGRAFLQGLTKEAAMVADSESAPATLVLEPGNPMSLVELTRAVSDGGAGMLVDPFFKPEHVSWLVTSTKVTRVLMRDPRGGLGPYSVALGHTRGAERLEIRSSGERELHDRCVIADDGSVTLIGTSVNSVGRHLTTLVRLPREDARSYRDRLEGLYEAASTIEPTRVDGVELEQRAEGES